MNELSIFETANLLGMSKPGVRRMIDRNELSSRLIDGKRGQPIAMIPVPEVVAVLNSKVQECEDRLSLMKNSLSVLVSPIGDKLVSPTSSLRLGNDSVSDMDAESPEL